MCNSTVEPNSSSVGIHFTDTKEDVTLELGGVYPLGKLFMVNHCFVYVEILIYLMLICTCSCNTNAYMLTVVSLKYLQSCLLMFRL